MNNNQKLFTRTTISWIFLLFILMPLWALGSDLKEMKGRIVFSSDRSSSWAIWSISADGSDLQQITKPGGDENDADPSINPDGKTILFSSTRGGKTGVWKIPIQGGEPERICDGDQAEWSPDGTLIAFRRDEAIWIREMASGSEKKITPADWPHASGPAWSPDGKTIAFACRWDAGNGIFRIGVEGGQPEKIFGQKGACEPHWSPDGKRLVYETETHLFTIQPDGKSNRPLTYFGGLQRYGQWSPDGQSIVYCQGASESGPWELYVIPAAGGTPARLTEGSSDLNPDWY